MASGEASLVAVARPWTQRLPVIGDVLAFRADPLGFFSDALAQQGETARVQLGHQTILVVTHADDVHRVLVEAHARFDKRVQGYDAVKAITGDGIARSNGAKWLKNRRALQPAFRRQRLDILADSTVARAERLAARLVAQPGPVDLGPELLALTIEVMGDVFFGVDLGASSRRLSDAMRVAVDELGPLLANPLPFARWLPTASNWRRARAVRVLDEAAQASVRAAREGADATPDRASLAALLPPAECPFHRLFEGSRARDELVTALVGGSETTANGLTWTLRLLASSPASAERLRAEVDAVLRGRPATLADLDRMPWLTQVVKESLRLYPSFWAIARRALGEVELRGHVARRGDVVFTSLLHAQRHPAFWRDPAVFDPDRFAPGEPRPPRGAYSPFADGPRMCIGREFALAEMPLVIATLVQRCELTVDDPSSGGFEPKMFALRARRPLVASVRAR